MNQCIVCECELTDINWCISCQKNHFYICIECHKEKGREYSKKHSTEACMRSKKYQKTKEGKLKHQKANKKYRWKHREELRLKDKLYRNTSQGIASVKRRKHKFMRTEKGKKLDAKCKAKRKRNLGFIQMFDNPFADNEEVDYHHITDVYVVAVPRDLHKLYCDKNHRENMLEVVKQIYL